MTATLSLPDRVQAVLALHSPTAYRPDGTVSYRHTVVLYCGTFGGCEGTDDDPCDIEEHEVDACRECRAITEYDEPGSLLWPCPTARLLIGDLPPEVAS